MAGIGFELRKILDRKSYLAFLQAYAYAGVIAAGPWVLSILGIAVIGLTSLLAQVPDQQIVQFRLSALYVIALSLILTGFMQLAFTRFISDRLFEKKLSVVVSNFHGVLFLTTLLSGTLGMGLAWALFPLQSFLYRVLMVGCLVVLSNIWVATIFLSGMKAYKAIVGLYALGYGTGVGAAVLFHMFGLEGLLLGFFLGQCILLIGMMALTFQTWPTDTFIAWDFLKKERIFWSLVVLGLCYNLAIWVDKFMFWFDPATSDAVIGPLRSSPFYDYPLFLAYLCLLPGMASFLVKMETDFVERNQEFFDAIREGAPLAYIQKAKREMIRSARSGLLEIMKIQFLVFLVVWALGPSLLRWLGVEELYAATFNIFVVGAGLHMVFLGILNVLFYLDNRRVALGLAITFLISNSLFTLGTLHLGLPFFGYGFTLSLFLVVILGLYGLDKNFQTLEYRTFMLQ